MKVSSKAIKSASKTPRVSVLTPKVRQKILQSSVVSFDVFDTLLLRPYVKPTHLFKHIEKQFSRAFFHDYRTTAEVIARKHSTKQDITIDDIYTQIDPHFQDLKQTELNWELSTLRLNPQMYEVYEFARKNGKRIIITSDMYLSSKFIANVLHKNGFVDYEKIYVSCETNATKSCGTMFDYIVQDLAIKPSQILHIGDNRNSDYKVPTKHGIHAIHYPSPIMSFIKQNSRIKRFYEKNNSDLGASILISMLAYRNLLKHNDNYWHNLGYEYTGPIVYGYTRWINQIAEKQDIKNLMFIARDGYTLQQVFNTFKSNIKTSYIYAPRFLNLIYRLEYRHGHSSVALAQQQTIINYYKNNNKLFDIYSKYDFKNHSSEYFIESNLPLLRKLANKKFQTYKTYLSTKVRNKGTKIGLVDTITENFSAQNLITDSLIQKQASITGFYWYARNHSPNHFVSFVDTSQQSPRPYIKNWGVMEFLMTSPEYPIEGISTDNKPIYKKHITPEEKHIREIYPDIAAGCFDFTKDICVLFNNNDIYLTYDTLVHWINCFCTLPTKQDFIQMETISTSTNPNNDVYESLFRTKIGFWYKFKHPVLYYKKIKSFMWKTPLEQIIVSILHPIAVHAHGLKDIVIYFFPKMNHRIFSINLRIGNCVALQIVLGAKHEI